MYRSAEFRNYILKNVSQNTSTINTYNSYLNRIDRLVGGLDEFIDNNGIESTIEFGKTAREGPFETYPSSARAVLKKYIQFFVDAGDSFSEIEGDDDEIEDSRSVFQVEREMQAAVRKQLSALEDGLKEADGGLETTVATGRIDIVAEDANGKLVVIELKAGVCPTGALEQVLGYAEALAEERDRTVRAILVASDFPDRVRAAAKRARDLDLRTYEFSLRFQEVK